MGINKRIIITSIIIFFIDQLSKYLIDKFLLVGESIKLIFNISLTRVSNSGAAFSILEGKTIFLLLISVVLIVIILKISKDSKNLLSDIYYGLIIGGILGNFLDRLVFSYVRDFIDVNLFGYNFPIFNIADSAIVIGIIIYIFSLVGEKNEVNR